MPSNKIKKEIKYGSIIIKLYEIKLEKVIERNESVANIQAFDLRGNLLWTIQPPTFSTLYFDMQIDEEKDILEADSGSGQVYEIDLKNGHIVRSDLRR